MTGAVTAASGAVAGANPRQPLDRGAEAARLRPTVGSGGIPGLHAPLTAAAQQRAPHLPPADVHAITGAAAALVARDGITAGVDAAAAMAGTAAAIQHATLPAGARQPMDWSAFGAVIPVLAGSPGSGATVVAAALADALQLAGRCVLLADAADPARSGLADAAVDEGLATRRLHEGLSVRYSWRHSALLARLESPHPIVPAMVPGPPGWLPPIRPVHVTVVDVGHDGWRAAADPLVGAGCWLRRGHPVPRPVLVVRATRPSLRGAEQVLARLHRWVTAGVASPPAQLVVVGARRWPRGVAGVAGRLLAGLLDEAVFLPRHPDIETGGVTGDLLPRQLLSAVTPLLQDWHLLDRPQKGRR